MSKQNIASKRRNTHSNVLWHWCRLRRSWLGWEGRQEAGKECPSLRCHEQWKRRWPCYWPWPAGWGGKYNFHKLSCASCLSLKIHVTSFSRCSIIFYLQKTLKSHCLDIWVNARGIFAGVWRCEHLHREL